MAKLRWIDWLVIGIIGFIIAFILISIVNFVNSGIELLSVYSPLVFPFLVGISMLICWILTIVFDIKRGGIKPDEDSKELLHDIGVTFTYVIAVLIYALVIRKLGFMIGTILFLAIGMIFMNYDERNMGKRVLSATLVSCITVPLLYYVFHEVFKVMLP